MSILCYLLMVVIYVAVKLSHKSLLLHVLFYCDYFSDRDNKGDMEF